MPSKKLTAKKRAELQDRKRSRPVTKRSAFEKNKLLLPLLTLIVVLAVVASIIVVVNPFEDTSVSELVDDDLQDEDIPDDGQEETNPVAVFDTSKGTFKVELYQDKAPKTVANFVKLVNDGFYDGMIFHRILDDFMIQAGNTMQDGTLKSSPYGDIEFESDPELTHVDGAISMASTGWAVGGSAQFFICDGAQSGLDGGYAVFGVTTSGMDVVRDIADDPQDNSSPAGGGKPITDIIINSITIE